MFLDISVKQEVESILLQAELSVSLTQLIFKIFKAHLKLLNKGNFEILYLII